MAFWIYMFFFCLMIPAIMTFFGKKFMTAAPKDINSSYGYRTNLSTKNRDTWEFAHKTAGKLWFVVGLILLAPSAIVMLFLFGHEIKFVGFWGVRLVFVQLAFLLGSIIPVEVSLRRVFNKDGSRKVK
ncbi:MAG: SdpI family protein [Ruminococcaceae bacterium]|nr:SdpI family protein [Oscillospiraceae bacterium]